eukprot:COSAG02_NODE_388_length_23287_cov_109.067017_13_plen_166_part_00
MGRYLDDVGTPLLGTVAIHTIAVVLGLGRSQPAGRLVNDRPGPGPGPGNEVPLPTGPFRGYLFETPTTVIAAVWMADAEYGTVGPVALSRLSDLQLQSVTVYNTFGNTLATRLTIDGLEFSMGRDVCYIVFPAENATHIHDAVAAMLKNAIPQVGGSISWPSPFL